MDREKEGFSWDKRKTYLYGGVQVRLESGDLP